MNHVITFGIRQSITISLEIVFREFGWIEWITSAAYFMFKMSPTWVWLIAVQKWKYFQVSVYCSIRFNALKMMYLKRATGKIFNIYITRGWVKSWKSSILLIWDFATRRCSLLSRVFHKSTASKENPWAFSQGKSLRICK